ncbi:MAG: glycosyltransferase [Opitutaceae bacterium]|jgi:glycosyltransferase involved in cell wall biosynthesis
MHAARILIISNGALCRNPRVVKEANTLGRAGHEVTVLTVRNHAASVPLDEALAKGAPFTHRWIDLLNGPQAWCRRARSRLAREAGLRFGLSLVDSLGPAHALLRAVRAEPADLVIAHNEIAHWVGTQLIAEGRRVCADIEDWHSEDLLPEDRAGRPLTLIRQVERELLQHAVHTTTTSNALADALHTRYGGQRPHVIGNTFPLQPDPRIGDPNEPPVFFWFSQTIGPGRGLEHFFSAWKLTRHPSRVVLLGEHSGDYMNIILSRLPADRRPCVSFLPLVPPAELPSLIARHDIGLALEQSFIVNRNLTITNKILQYLNAGLAVVASDTAGQREVLSHASGAGLVVETHETTRFAIALDGLLSDRASLRHHQQAARLLAEQTYCWEHDAPQLVNLVDRALATPV